MSEYDARSVYVRATHRPRRPVPALRGGPGAPWCVLVRWGEDGRVTTLCGSINRSVTIRDAIPRRGVLCEACAVLS